MQKTVNAATFRKMFSSGVKNLEAYKNKVDALNVFPVPDGDTGTNMSLTLANALKELNSTSGSEFSVICDAISKGALRGARGNSGVILSQILKGFCSAIKKADNIDSLVIAKAFGLGTEIAYEAVSKPQEGTILTVVRMIAEFAATAYKKVPDLEEFFVKILEKGEEALAQTPEILPILKKAGVVDAGGYGLLIFIRGMYLCLIGEPIESDFTPEPQVIEAFAEHPDFSNLGEITFAYCTEFFVVNIKKRTTQTDIDRFKNKLLELGDSVVVVGDLEFLKIHIHTNEPGIALTHALELGEIDKIKIENMLEQNRELIAKHQAPHKEMGMLAVCAGSGLVAIFKELAVDKIIEGGQTMNPSANDIMEAINKINADHVFVFPNNKNIILAAEQAKALIENKTIHVVPTKNVPQGIAAAIAFNPEASVDENTESILKAIHGVDVGQVTFAVRTTSIDGFDLNEGDIIGLDGKRILSKGSEVNSVVSDLITQIKRPNHEMLTLYYGNNVTKDEADALCEELTDKHPDCEIVALNGGQPLYYYVFSLE